MIYIAVLNNLIVNGSARFLNKLYANDVDIGSDVAISGKTTTGQLVINGGTNFGNLGSGNSNNAPLVIGNPNGTHIAIDYDEIQRKNNATTAGDLYLNDSGGNVYLSNGKKIYASNGTFITPALRATNIGDNNNVVSTAFIATGNITTLNTDQVNVKNIDAENVDVKYNLKASHYDLQTVSQLGGVFRVAPSISIPSTVTPSTNVKTTSVTVTKSSSSATIAIVDNSINNGDSQGDIPTTTPYIGGITCAFGAYIMCSGTIGDVVTGTMFGKITTINTNSRTLTLNITSGYDGLVAGTYSASQISGLTVVLYKNHSNYPVGIELNSYGTSVGRTYVDVYGGTSNEPSVRIGNIGGLSYNGGTLENQWGIYTDNGYFKGAIVSTEGKIGGFDIGQTNIRNAVTSLTDSSHTGIYLGTDGIRNYNTTGSKHVTIKDGTITANSVDLTGAIKATSGFIGQNATNGFTISNTAIYNPSTKSSLGSDTVDGVYVGKDGIALGKGVFKVTNAGAVTASNINASGGTIGGWSIGTDTNKSLYYGGTTPSATNLVLSKGTVANSTSVGGSTGSLSWMILAGNKFGVTTGGALYASEANISGAINATFLNVGSASSSNHLIYNSTTGIIDLSTDWLKFVDNAVIIGKDDKSHISIDYHSFIMQDSEDEFFRVEDKRNNQGIATITDTSPVIEKYNSWRSSSQYKTIVTDCYPEEINSVIIQNAEDSTQTTDVTEDDNVYTQNTTYLDNLRFDRSNLPYTKNIIKIEYTTTEKAISFTFGSRNSSKNVGKISFASGSEVIASGSFSHVEGGFSEASGSYSHAEGTLTIASGQSSHAEGNTTKAAGIYSHAEGSEAEAMGQASHAEGYKTIAYGSYSHAEGDSTIALNGSHAEGNDTYAQGMSSHVEGDHTVTTNGASFAHAEGYYSKAEDFAAHAEGYETCAASAGSHAEGRGSSVVSGADSAHAEGYNTLARGIASHVGGYGTITSLETAQTVIGKYNKATVTGSGTDADPYVYTNIGDYAFIIGNGTGNTTSARSNALTVDWNGVVSCGGISTSGTITAANHQMGIVEAMAKTTTNANSGGVTAYWYYRKWSNNLVECWTTSSVSIAPTAANTKANRRITLPVTIPTKYSMQATIRGIPEIATCHIGLENINDNEIRLYIYESNTTPRSVDIYVIGSQ